MDDQSETVPTNFNAWAETVDGTPVPIDYTYGTIGELLPEIAKGVRVRELWFKAWAVVAGTDESEIKQSWFYEVTVSAIIPEVHLTSITG